MFEIIGRHHDRVGDHVGGGSGVEANLAHGPVKRLAGQGVNGEGHRQALVQLPHVRLVDQRPDLKAFQSLAIRKRERRSWRGRPSGRC